MIRRSSGIEVVGFMASPKRRQYWCLPCVGDDKRADAHKHLSDGSGMTQEFSADETSTTVMGAKSLTFKLGEAIDSITLDGRKVKVVFSVDGEKLVEKQSEDGFECQHVRQGSGDTLTMILTGGGQTCIRTFVKS
ncbi:fatty acid-binding protein, heart-like [Mya arenaria]|uniref:fatty acid-binding protein, heart-like n=1 Tax=Mya arenaria TaxID=6604 RepID=UPI0022E2FC08|nr:fatty acid-binding protein, heart-like [Mya arenaria]